MEYKTWHKQQTDEKIYGQVKKPIHYKVSQMRAMDKLLASWIGGLGDFDCSFFDAGCATGEAMLFAHYLGFERVYGCDINKRKIEVAKNLGLDVVCEDVTNLIWKPEDHFDVIWCSHVFEHMINPELALKYMRNALKDTGRMYFILPYVDTGDLTAHCASEEIGLRENDNAFSVSNWFSSRGMKITNLEFSDIREPEVWLEMRKNE